MSSAKKSSPKKSTMIEIIDPQSQLALEMEELPFPINYFK